MTNDEIVIELYTLKANADEVSSRCSRLITKLQPIGVPKKNGLMDAQRARIRAKGQLTILTRNSR